MSDDKTRQDQPDADSSSKDKYADLLRDLPRLRSAERSEGPPPPYIPPPPMVSRMGGAAQGCSAIFLTLLSAPMLLVSIWFGYHLWGPALLVTSGLLLLFATGGVWGGRRAPLVVAILLILVAVGVGYAWSSFLPVVGALGPLGSLGLLYVPVSRAVAMGLLATLVVNLLTLSYWRRLKAPSRQAVILWGVAMLVMVFLSVGFHLTQQQQRKAWMEDRLKVWSAEAVSDSLILGANADATIGSSFLTLNPEDDPRYDVRAAEFQAIMTTGVPAVRLVVSGDMRLERIEPYLFKTGQDGSEQDPATQQARLDRQEQLETRYMAMVIESGADLYLADAPYSPYLVVKTNENGKMDWETFTALHTERIVYYATLYQPAGYEIITEPSVYSSYSGVQEPEDRDPVDVWIEYVQTLSDAVHAVSPATRIGVSVGLDSAFERRFYERVLEVDGVAYIGLRLYQPGAFSLIEQLIEEIGHPADYPVDAAQPELGNKEFWIAETWYGYCLAPQRSMTLDSIWLEATVAFAAKEEFSAVMTNDFGCFLQAGGPLYSDKVDLQGRTETWHAWRALVAAWSPGAGG